MSHASLRPPGPAGPRPSRSGRDRSDRIDLGAGPGDPWDAARGGPTIGREDADVVGLLLRLEPRPLRHDGVGPRQRQEAPVGPIAQLRPPGPELVHLLLGQLARQDILDRLSIRGFRVVVLFCG